MTADRILFVDDDANILQSCQRQLRKQFSVETANSGAEGLWLLASNGEYAVIVSDMRMPEMDGVQFFAQAQKIVPNAVRVMLTGNADQQTAIDAVNSGHIFRFLNKPCPPPLLVQTLNACLQQYRLVTAERDLLAKTFSGSVGLLTEVLSLVKPQIFGRAGHIKRLVTEVCRRMNVSNTWEVTVAAMLSQLGCIAVAEPILAKVAAGKPLLPAEAGAFREHAAVGQRLIGRIPRLEGVAEIIGRQFEDHRLCPDGESEDQRRIRLGANILRVVLDFDALVGGGSLVSAALRELTSRGSDNDRQIIAALSQSLEIQPEARSVKIAELTEGMLLDEDIETLGGNMLVARGQEVTAWMCERLRLQSGSAQGVKEPIRVLCRAVTAS